MIKQKLNHTLRSKFIKAVNCFLFLMLISNISKAQVFSDSIPEIEIWGFPEEKFAVGNQISRLDSGLKLFFATESLADILQQTTPVYIRAYGPGNLASISFRGTGANHTAVLWNGININSPTLGQSDFYLLPNLAFNEISIQHGNGSALYGTDAIGGTVQLGNSATQQEGWGVQLSQTIGSFGKRQTALGTTWGKRNIEIATKVYHTRATNDFKFINTERIGSPEQRQQNAAYEQWGITNDIFWEMSHQDKLTAHVWYHNSHREIQPPMSRLTDNDQQWDQNFRSLISYQHLSEWGTSTVKGSWVRDLLRFDDGALVDSRILTNRFTGIISQEKRFGKGFETKAGVQLTHFRADVDNYAANTKESRWDFFWLSTLKLHDRLKASLQFRQTLLQNFNPPFTPSLGLEAIVLEKPHHQLKLMGNLSKSYRVPTLNERFWEPGGNPDLIPEESRGGEVSIHHQYKKSPFIVRISATYFHTKIDNWVFWRPVPPNGFFSPQNVQKVRTEGLEIKGQLTWKLKNWKHSLTANYAYTEGVILESDEPSTVNTALFYVPNHKATLFYGLQYKGYGFQYTAAHTGTRIAIARNELEAFTLMDIGLSRQLKWKKSTFNLQLKMNNLLDKAYQNYEFYAQPGRNYEVSLTWKI